MCAPVCAKPSSPGAPVTKRPAILPHEALPLGTGYTGARASPLPWGKAAIRQRLLFSPARQTPKTNTQDPNLRVVCQRAHSAQGCGSRKAPAALAAASRVNPPALPLQGCRRPLRSAALAGPACRRSAPEERSYLQSHQRNWGVKTTRGKKGEGISSPGTFVPVPAGLLALLLFPLPLPCSLRQFSHPVLTFSSSFREHPRVIHG